MGVTGTGATWLYLDGVDIKTISQMLGHTTTAQTEAYIGVIPKNLIEASKKMERRFIFVENPDLTVVNTVCHEFKKCYLCLRYNV